MTVKIVTDSTCDLPQSVIAQYGITVVPLYINIGPQSYLDGVDLSREAFYQGLPAYSTSPATAAPGPEVFKRVYENLAARGATEIISIHISVSLSGTVNSARLGAAEVKSVPVTVLDSGQLTLGLGLLVLQAARAAAHGCTVAEIMPVLQDQMGRSYVAAMIDTLEFLKRSGRMNGMMAGVGSLLQIKPILRMHNGNPTSEKVRTYKRAMDRLVGILMEISPFEQIAMVHTCAPQRAEALKQRMAHLLPAGLEIFSMDITPVLGAHLGPGAVGFACVSAKK